jgi:hypothetical protein
MSCYEDDETGRVYRTHRTRFWYRNRPLGRPRRRWEEGIKILGNRMGFGLDSSGSGQRPAEGSYKYGNEPLGSIKYLEFLEWFSNWRLLKNNSALWPITRINDK